MIIKLCTICGSDLDDKDEHACSEEPCGDPDAAQTTSTEIYESAWAEKNDWRWR